MEEAAGRKLTVRLLVLPCPHCQKFLDSRPSSILQCRFLGGSADLRWFVEAPLLTGIIGTDRSLLVLQFFLALPG